MNLKQLISRLFSFTALSLLTLVNPYYIPAQFPPVEQAYSNQLKQPTISESYGSLPLTFEANEGQTNKQVKFISRGVGYSLFLTCTEAILTLRKLHETKSFEGYSLGVRNPDLGNNISEPVEQSAVLMQLVGANATPTISGLDELPSKVNYFLGDNHDGWQTGISTFSKVEYKDVYPGINLVYYGNQQQLEYDFVVNPGADPSAISLDFQGVDKVELDEGGAVNVLIEGKVIQLQKPVIYQEMLGSKLPITGGYKLSENNQVSFQIGLYNKLQRLIIDPVLVYSTYLGGSGGENAIAIKTDPQGYLYIYGDTSSINFPTVNPYDSTRSGQDAFVTKINPSGTSIVYSTYIGGSSTEQQGDMTVDDDGNIYITGNTFSSNYPVVNAIQNSKIGSTDTFITKINRLGNSLDFSTYYGGSSDNEGGFNIAVDQNKNVIVTGLSPSADFPEVNPLFPGTSPFNQGSFLVRLDPSGTTTLNSFFLLQSGTIQGLTLDAVGNIYVTGVIGDWAGPVLPLVNAYQPYNAGSEDAFIMKINSSLTSLLFSTYLGGSKGDPAYDIEVDNQNNAYIIGHTYSSNFPVTPDAYQGALGGGSYVGSSDMYIVKFDTSGALTYSTYLGGDDTDFPYGLDIDQQGNLFIAAGTTSPNFPLIDPIQSVLLGGYDPVIIELNSAGTPIFSSFFGSTMQDGGLEGGITLSPDENYVYIAGGTYATNFPIKNPIQSTNAGGFDLVIAKIGLSNEPIENTPVGTNVTVSPTTGAELIFSNVSSAGNTSMTTSNTGPTPPSGFSFGDTPTYYDITTTATYDPPVTVCIAYDPTQYANPEFLRLLHYENNAWMDVMISNDTINNIVCGQVNNLSPFVVAQRLYNFTGFFQPVDNLPVLNAVNAGKAIPVKFSLGGNQGLNIFEAGYPKSQAIACYSTAPVDGIEETLTAGSSNLSYDANTNTYIYVWKTDKAWANTCRQLVVKLIDGTFHRANLKFTK